MASIQWTGQLRKLNLSGQHIFGTLTETGVVDTTMISGFEVPASWIQGTGGAYVKRFVLNGTVDLDNDGQVTLHLASSDSDDSGVAGPHFLDSLETAIQITVQVGSESVNAVLNDSSEPYEWIPSSSADVISFVDGLSDGLHNVTITLDDGQTTDLLISGTATAGNPSASGAPTATNPTTISGTATAGNPSASGTVATADFATISGTATAGNPSASGTVALGIAALVSGTATAGNPSASGTVATADAVRVTFGAATYDASSGSVMVEVNLSEALAEDATIEFVVERGDRTVGSDYTVPASVTFLAGETTKNVLVESHAADTFADWDDIIALEFGVKDSDGVDRSEIFSFEGWDVDEAIGIWRKPAGGDPPVVVAFSCDEPPEAITDSNNDTVAYRMEVTRQSVLDKGMNEQVAPEVGENYVSRLVLPFFANPDVESRRANNFQVLITAALATTLENLSETADWPDTAVLAANEATPGPNRPGDRVTLYRGGLTRTKAWDDVTAKWVNINGWIGGNLIVQGGIQTDHLGAQVVVAEKIAADAVTAAKIAADAVTAAKIAANAIMALHIMSGQITAGKLAAGSVTTQKLAAGSVTADKASFNSLSALGLQVVNADISGVISAAHIDSDVFNVYHLFNGNVFVDGTTARTVAFSYPDGVTSADVDAYLINAAGYHDNGTNRALAYVGGAKTAIQTIASATASVPSTQPEISIAYDDSNVSHGYIAKYPNATNVQGLRIRGEDGNERFRIYSVFGLGYPS